MRKSLLAVGPVDAQDVDARPFSLFAKGFRPFFLLASLAAALLVSAWVLMLRGHLGAGTYFLPTVWHMHEMIFGFATAVIAGFLLTAVGNWTSRETIIGMPLAALAALWLFGRLAVAFGGSLPRGLPAIVDLSFLPLLVFVLARPLVFAKNRRNFVMLAILALLFAANGVCHLEALSWVRVGAARQACIVALDIVLVLIAIIAGRVFPMFTKNATGVATVRSIKSLEVLTVTGLILVTALDAMLPESVAAPMVAGATGVVATLRTMHWGARHSLRNPLLWILHVGYLWLPLGLVLRAGAGFFAAIPATIGVHALTVGCIGSLCLGMISRVTLGHTGRALVAPKPVTVAFVLITTAAVVRCVGPLLSASAYATSLALSGALWAVAFALYAISCAPILCTPRVDGGS